MRRLAVSPLTMATLATVAVLATMACKDEPAANTGPEPMRPPPGGYPDAAPIQTPSEPETNASGETEPRETLPLPERPRADPAIERALDLISASGLRFIDPASEPDERPSEYTSEQFAGMLRTKWDWIGYDLTELDPWLDNIATRSFKTSLAYQVVLANGTTSDLRPWLDTQLRAPVGDP